MKRFLTILFLIMAASTMFAQKTTERRYAKIDEIARQLPDSLANTTDQIAEYIQANFATDIEKCRAIFAWIAYNIEYDIGNMYAINLYEKSEEKIAKPLRTKKGICENYASLFTDICIKVGIKSFVIEGYSRQDAFAGYFAHAWCTALVDNVWCLFDPTWGSGFIKDGKFIRSINNAYFKVSPMTLIKSHMPFDYLWQLLNYPITNQEFYEGKTKQDKTKPFFHFNDTIKVYETQDYIDQLRSSSYRIEKNGVKNSFIFDMLRHHKLEVENDRQTKIVDLFNSAVADYNDGIIALNDFIYYKNKQFVPQKSDPEIQLMIDLVRSKLATARSKLGQISDPDDSVIDMIKQLTKSISDTSKQLSEQQDWLKFYLSKSVSERKSLFYRK